MYEKVKKLVPLKLLKKNEQQIRSLFSILYIGSKYSCNICNFKTRKFLLLANNDKLCPKCGSLGRTRRLWDLLEPKIKEKKSYTFLLQKV